MPAVTTYDLAAGGLAPAATGATARDPASARAAELARRSAEANARLMRGDIDGYRALVPLSDDFTLFSPVRRNAARAARR